MYTVPCCNCSKCFFVPNFSNTQINLSVADLERFSINNKTGLSKEALLLLPSINFRKWLQKLANGGYRDGWIRSRINFLTEILRDPGSRCSPCPLFFIEVLEVGKLTQRCALRIPHARQAVGVLLSVYRFAKTPASSGGFHKSTEREGFEPSRRLPPYRFSRPAVSTTHTPLQIGPYCVKVDYSRIMARAGHARR